MLADAYILTFRTVFLFFTIIIVNPNDTILSLVRFIHFSAIFFLRRTTNFKFTYSDSIIVLNAAHFFFLTSSDFLCKDKIIIKSTLMLANITNLIQFNHNSR